MSKIITTMIALVIGGIIILAVFVFYFSKCLYDSNKNVLYIYTQKASHPYTGSIIRFSGENTDNTVYLSGCDLGAFAYRKLHIDSESYWTFRIYIRKLLWITILIITFLAVLFYYSRNFIKNKLITAPPDDGS